MIRGLVFILFAGLLAFSAQGQSFLQQQLQYPTVKKAFEQKNEILKKEFEKKGLTYPPKEIFIRSFKYDSKLEVWVRNKRTDTFSLFKTYNICALSGYMGRKKYEGDRQVPEGFYYINKFNPSSAYHLALKINYPNFSDRLNGSSSKDLGGGIYIHGSCVTVGCIPITNPQIDELYILALYAQDAGQNFIPVHVFPIDFNNKRSIKYLAKVAKTGDPVLEFWMKLKKAFNYFNATHRLPIIMYDGKGDYVVKKGRSMIPLRKHFTINKAGEDMAPGL